MKPCYPEFLCIINQLQQFSHISAVIHVQVIDLDDTAPVFDLDLSSFEILEFDDLGAGFSSTLIFMFIFHFQQKGIDKLFIIFV